MTLRNSAVTCELQTFESGIFGGPVFRLVLDIGRSKETIAADLALAKRTICESKYRLASCRVREDAVEAIAALKEAGFREIEHLVTFQRALTGNEAAPVREISVAVTADHPAILKIARTGFAFDRFHTDPMIFPEIADAVKEAWLANNLDGRADAVLVARQNTEVVGFCACLYRNEIAVIDLISVGERYRRSGYAKDLVLGAQHHYRRRASCMQVGTQANNHASIRLYEGAGFARLRTALTFHLTPTNEQL